MEPIRARNGLMIWKCKGGNACIYSWTLHSYSRVAGTDLIIINQLINQSRIESRHRVMSRPDLFGDLASRAKESGMSRVLELGCEFAVGATSGLT